MSTAVGRDWVGRVINGEYPLLEWLGGSNGTGLFVTGLGGSQRAVIRLFQGSAREAANPNLSHPHLAAVLAAGEAQVDGGQIGYVVTEYAEEVLSQILPERALSADETREMLAPVLDALGYLHGKGFVHGHLKPAHILVIRENLKLSSDQIEVAGQPRLHVAAPRIYDAPEYGDSVSAAEDLWSLGITLVEALTQRPPEWNQARGDSPVVPGNIPAPFAEIARRCLESDPAKRCTLDDVKALLEGKTIAQQAAATPPASPASRKSVLPAPPAQPPAARPATQSPPLAQPRPAWQPPEEPRKRWLMPVVAIFILVLAIIGVIQMKSCGSTKTAQVQPQPQAPGADSQQAPTPAPAPPAADSKPGPSAKGSVVKRVMPDVSEGASQTIHGTVKVVVRATVDTNGQVSGTEFQSAGPSKYFARVAQEAARSWKFKPAQANGHAIPSVWLLLFEFRRDGNEASASQQTP
ncbi:MAG TPA: TonB family protein [Terracidiphilus sp.]|nr:TonB family protein [Terracidiphilus sp.]